MGEFTNFNDSPEGQIAKDRDQAVEVPDGKVETDIKGCFADAINSRDNLPVFKVNHKDFHQNMTYGRKRIRFESGSDAQKFMKNSRYKQSFWIQHQDTKFMRKIK